MSSDQHVPFLSFACQECTQITKFVEYAYRKGYPKEERVYVSICEDCYNSGRWVMINE